MKLQASSNSAPTTIVDVANSAGVSIKTVSRVINSEPRVTAGTREKVLRAIEDLGYQRNMFARGLRAEKSLVLGLLYENPQGDYPSDVLHGALTHCRESGYHLQVEVLRGREMATQTVKFLTETRLDGALLTPPVCDNAMVLAALEKFEVPFVRISPNRPRPNECYIAIDDRAAAVALVDYLASLGHRRIGFIKGIRGHAATKLRHAGYRRALARCKIEYDPSLVVAGSFDFESGIAGAARLMTLADPPTAIFACNDETAAGALCWAHDRGVAVPDELSICGFDGGTISRVVWPALTTVRQPIRDLGMTAVRRLIDINAGKNHAGAPLILPFDLVAGGSTGEREPRSHD
ncbi:MAG: LacI family DNA-binding transcriptional regulator [Parvularculaceae bacterium]